MQSVERPPGPVEEFYFLRQRFRIQLVGISVRRLHDREDASQLFRAGTEPSGREAECGCFQEIASIGHSIEGVMSTPKPGLSEG